MTAEIAVYNKMGIALAADSATHIGNGKISNSATKLFTLGADHSVGVMLYGNANLFTTPWELLINLYRQQLGTKPFQNLQAYGESFFKFVKQLTIFGPQFDKESFMSYWIDFIDVLKDQVKHMPFDDVTTEAEIEECFGYALEHTYQLSTNDDGVNLTIDRAALLDDYGEFIDHDFAEQIDVTLNNAMFDNLIDHFIAFMVGPVFSSEATGIVFAGYGSDDIFPRAYQYRIDGRFQGQYKLGLFERVQVGNDEAESDSGLCPFAQSDMILTMVNGIDPDLADYHDLQISKLQHSIEANFDFDDDSQVSLKTIFTDSLRKSHQYRQENYTSHMINMIRYLSVSELATFAQTMISLTLFKRRFSEDTETVGGNVNVLTITKGAGAEWVSAQPLG